MATLLSSATPGQSMMTSLVSNDDPVKASVIHLLSKASTLPCSTAAQAFNQLVQPTLRFQLALEALLPRLDPKYPSELEQRILVSFLLYSLYAPHPIGLNPFKSVLFGTFVTEREKAMNGTGESEEPGSNEQFVWVLWKILKGDGNDIGPYSPITLAKSPLPSKLRATNLSLDDDLYLNDIDDFRAVSTPDKTVLPNSSSATSVGETKPTALHDNSTAAITAIAEEDARKETIANAMKLLLEARERVLTLSESRVVTPVIPELASSQMITPLDLAPMISYNPGLAHPLFAALLSLTSPDNNLPSPFLEILPYLTPSLQTFDLMGRLLQDSTRTSSGHTTITDLVRTEVLGRFIHESITWLEEAEAQEREGVISDDRFSKGVQNLCRFYNSLIKLRIIDPQSEEDVVEMLHFSLRNSRLEEANSLYRVLVTTGKL